MCIPVGKIMRVHSLIYSCVHFLIGELLLNSCKGIAFGEHFAMMTGRDTIHPEDLRVDMQGSYGN